MKNLSLLQKKAGMALFLCMSVSLFSCSNEEEFSPVNEKVIPALEVSKMSDWLPKREALSMNPVICPFFISKMNRPIMKPLPAQ